MSVRDLPARFRAEADHLAAYAPAAATAWRLAASQLEAELVSDYASVTLTEASLQGGYSPDHLQRCVATGKIENVGKKGRPRIRSSDVPIKPGYLPTGTKGDQLSDRRRIVAAAKHQEAAS